MSERYENSDEQSLLSLACALEVISIAIYIGVVFLFLIAFISSLSV